MIIANVTAHITQFQAKAAAVDAATAELANAQSFHTAATARLTAAQAALPTAQAQLAAAGGELAAAIQN